MIKYVVLFTLIFTIAFAVHYNGGLDSLQAQSVKKQYKQYNGVKSKGKKGMNNHRSSGHEITFTGTVSDRGVECPAVISDDGRFYTLTNVDRKKLHPGMRVQVHGVTRRMSKCMQGQTLSVKSWKSIGN